MQEKLQNLYLVEIVGTTSQYMGKKLKMVKDSTLFLERGLHKIIDKNIVKFYKNSDFG